MDMTLAKMRAALARGGNPVEIQNIGVNEAPDMAPKAYVSPDVHESYSLPTGGVSTLSGISIGNAPNQQLTPDPFSGSQQAQMPGGSMPAAQPNPLPTGLGGQAMAQPSNILSMTQQGRALNAMQPSMPQRMADGGSAKAKAQMMKDKEDKSQPTSSRMLIQAEGPGGVKGIKVPKHMWYGSKTVDGMQDVNEARAKVYGSENRPPLTIGQIGKIHKETLEDHFKKPVEDQIADENAALNRLRSARHIGKTADTLDESEKLDTVRHEHDDQGRTYVGYAAKGTAGHALYTSGHGDNQKFHVLNTCPGQTEGCGGGVDEKGVVDTMKGTCFAPVAETQYAGAAVRRASHAQAKHDPAMTRDWILAHTGSLRNAANRADKKDQRLLFRPNVVDETDVSSRHAIKHLNNQRKLDDKPPITANSYGKTNELHDPENGYHVTHSNVGPKTKHGYSVAENIARDKQRVRSTITATTGSGKDLVNDEGNKTPPKGSYMVTNVKRGSPMSELMEKHITHAKYWSTGREPHELSEEEKAEGPEGHFDGRGKDTTPEKAHYGHTTVNGRRYDYQKQHILHPRLVQVGHNDDGTPHMIPTDSRFKDEEFLPKNRFKTKNGKVAGAILMTTPTTSTSGVQHHTSFTHPVDQTHINYAKKNKGEYEIDPPKQQEASKGKEYSPPQPIKFMADGGKVTHLRHGLDDDDFHAFPERNFASQRHLAMRGEREEDETPKQQSKLKKPVVVHKGTGTMQFEMIMKKKGK